MKEHNQDDWYSFDSVENYDFEDKVKPTYKTVISATTNTSFFNFGKSSIEEEIFSSLKKKEKMRRLRILISLK